MNKYVSRGLMGALFVGGIWALGTTAANAATTTGDDGLLSGTQVGAVVEAPVSALGNAVSVLGDSSSTAVAPAAPAAAPAAPAAAPAAPVAPAAPAAPVTTTSGDSGVLSGTQGIVSVDVPVTVGGNAISVLGDSAAAAPAPAPAAPVASAPATTSGDDSIGSGTQGLVDVTLPVTVGGNAISVLGDSASTGTPTEAPAGGAADAVPAGSATGTTSGDDGILGGTQVVPSVGLPVTVGGNAVSVIGDSSSTGSTTAPAVGSGIGSTTDGAATSGDDSVAGGTQVIPTVTTPVTVGGNAISVVGDSASTGTTAGTGTTDTGTGSTGGTTSGDDGILGGTQVVPSVGLPVTVGGNAISVVGDSASTGTTTGTGTTGTGSTGGTTSGDDGILGGTQVVPSITLPIDLSGNAVAVIGDSDVTDGTTDTTPIDPTTPTDPTDPTIPVDPAEPFDPTDPVDPTTPTTPGDDGTTTPDTEGTAGIDGFAGTTGTVLVTAASADRSVLASGTSASSALAADSSLAFTGGDTTAPLAGGLLALLAGLGLLVAARRRTARA